jgi:hypothetical protein
LATQNALPPKLDLATDFANEGKPQASAVTFSQSMAPLALVGRDVTVGIS